LALTPQAPQELEHRVERQRRLEREALGPRDDDPGGSRHSARLAQKPCLADPRLADNEQRVGVSAQQAMAELIDPLQLDLPPDERRRLAHLASEAQSCRVLKSGVPLMTRRAGRRTLAGVAEGFSSHDVPADDHAVLRTFDELAGFLRSSTEAEPAEAKSEEHDEEDDE
jgi:hypothetical protein